MFVHLPRKSPKDFPITELKLIKYLRQLVLKLFNLSSVGKQPFA